MQAGKHVYVEKPLTRTVWEARLLAQAAEKYKVATDGKPGILYRGDSAWLARSFGRERSAM